MNKIAIVTINKPSFLSGYKLSQLLSNEYNVELYTSKKTSDILDKNYTTYNIYNKLDDVLEVAWDSFDAIICILSIGAVVRKIAPYLKGKDVDPAVVVLNLDLTKIVPILSGHLGGANKLSEVLQKKLPNSINFISTATDQTSTLAFEMVAKKNNWDIKNLKALANISNRLLNDQIVKVATYRSIFDTLPNKKNLTLVDFDNIDLDTVVIAPHISSSTLTLQPKISLGIGCNKDTQSSLIEKALFEFLDRYNLTINQIDYISSFEAKKDEKGLLEVIAKYHLKSKFFTKEDINNLENDFSKSASTKFFGIKGVAEPSAILSSKYQELIIKKEVFFKSITIACAI